jgi:hypothetical protein
MFITGNKLDTDVPQIASLLGMDWTLTNKQNDFQAKLICIKNVSLLISGND